jgi:hypothetical protein
MEDAAGKPCHKRVDIDVAEGGRSARGDDPEAAAGEPRRAPAGLRAAGLQALPVGVSQGRLDGQGMRVEVTILVSVEQRVWPGMLRMFLVMGTVLPPCSPR